MQFALTVLGPDDPFACVVGRFDVADVRLGIESPPAKRHAAAANGCTACCRPWRLVPIRRAIVGGDHATIKELAATGIAGTKGAAKWGSNLAARLQRTLWVRRASSIHRPPSAYGFERFTSNCS